jgi:hypothetical protein
MDQLVYIMLLLGMGSENYRERQISTYILKNCGPVGVAYAHVGIDSPSLEISMRCRPIVRDHLYSAISSLGQMPWLDMMPHDYPNRHQIMAEYLQYGSGDPWHHHKMAAWHFFTDKIISGEMTVAEARGLIEVMHRRGIEWCKANKRRYEEFDWNP